MDRIRPAGSRAGPLRRVNEADSLRISRPPTLAPLVSFSFREVHRTLQPGGPFIVVFSNRMFPTKAVYIWRVTSDVQHTELVQLYFHLAGGYERVTALDRTPQVDGYTDAVYIVMAHKQ